MIKANIAVLDSGIGGLSVLSVLNKKLFGKRFFYFGDNLNAPYGNKTLNELRRISTNNISFLIDYNIDAIVLGCNTLSVNLLHEIEYFSGVKTFGVFPPVEYARITGGKTLLLSTVSTAGNYKASEQIFPLGLEYLARDIEKNVYDLSKIDLMMHIKPHIKEKNYFDTVILGCTHYEFIKNKIFNHLKPQKILSGVNFTADLVSEFFQDDKSLVKCRQNEIYFIGKNAEYNRGIFSLVVKGVLNL